MHGVQGSIRNEDAITFIGTLLTINDTKFETIIPHKKGEVPSKVMLIIDGQQRLTTMLLIMTVLHDQLKINEVALQKYLNLALKEKDKSPQSELGVQIRNLEWLLDKITQEVASLRYFSTDTNSNRDKIYRWYPKLIRAYKDCWSKVEDGVKYESPIARYLHLYNQYVLQSQEDKYIGFKYKIDDGHQDFEAHQIIIKNIGVIKSNVKKICGSNAVLSEDKLPSFNELMSGGFGRSFQFEIPEEYLSEDVNKKIKDTLNLIVFAKYLLHRVCVTYVTVTDEAYAFDMFEALNTTGEPLTSIETFKPKVIEEEGLSKYELSDSKKYFDHIDRYLDSISDATKKHKETTRIMLSFALSETGEKISKHISDQRRYLIDSYRDEGANTKKGFVKNLSYTTRFYYEEWDSSQPSIFNDSGDEVNTLRLCLDVLKESKHEITIPLITRFYSPLLDDSSSQVARGELLKCMKSIIAFFVLWRASHKSTSGIDSVYRDILKNGDSSLGISGLSRRLTGGQLSSKTLSLILRERLRKKFDVSNGELKDKWLKAAIKNPVYDISIPLTRIMMLAAFHNTCPDSEKKGLVEAGIKDSNPMLSWHKWRLFSGESADHRFTVEHIAPQELTDEWGQSLYENIDLVHCIGNLTILPSNANSSASNKSWDKKRKYYEALCQDSKRQKEKLLGDDFSSNQKIMLEKIQYLGYLEPLTQVDEWDAEFILARSENLLSHIWDEFDLWLDNG